MVFQKSSLSVFTEAQTAIEISKSIKGKDLSLIRDGVSYTLATARKESSLMIAENLISQFILNLCNDLNLIHKVSEQSINAMAEDVYSIGYFLKIEELAYFFKELRRGKYGSMYENLNSEKVCIALNRFISERSQHFERKNEGLHKQQKDSGLKRTNKESEFKEQSKKALNRFDVNSKDGII